ncbi:hypothetical protein FTUN_5912 [Frigoriglobus tundricola]|uniref:Uncharacterized protein n=1 Tax=Frigoriglobus tundricola TaxID=2774151 RepID=A0A6M5YXU3_9BACT|nr:hypothetical protein FTUN_5912 [Frigoriglobus tundricola]
MCLLFGHCFLRPRCGVRQRWTAEGHRGKWRGPWPLNIAQAGCLRSCRSKRCERSRRFGAADERSNRKPVAP